MIKKIFFYRPEEAKELAEKMLGHNLVTKQTGAEGKPCNAVYICERKYARNEYYFAILLDRKSAGPVIVASSQGGVDIETVAHNTPEAIITLPIDSKVGFTHELALKLAKDMGFTPRVKNKLLRLSSTSSSFSTKRMLLKLKLTPCLNLAITKVKKKGRKREKKRESKKKMLISFYMIVLCMDAKLNFDDNASFKQKEVFDMRDFTQEDPREIAAAKFNLNYIGLDGNIGCLGKLGCYK